ncbi:MAG: hypothetical protein K9G49_04360 [Taibaiella sp.]|nr:hypothetical protein [Taibaiella sp.]
MDRSMLKNNDRGRIGTVFFTQVVAFVDFNLFEDSEGSICHVPYKFRNLLNVDDFVICRVCEYKRHRYDSNTRKIVFDGELYICSSVQIYGTKSKIMALWNADEVLEKQGLEYVKRQTAKIKADRRKLKM